MAASHSGKNWSVALAASCFFWSASSFPHSCSLLLRESMPRIRDSYRRKGRLVVLKDVLKFADSDGGLLLVEFGSPGVFRRTWWVQSEKIEVLESSLPPVNKDQILDSIEQRFRRSSEPEYVEILNSLSNSVQLVDVRPSFWTRKQRHKLPSARMIDEKFTRGFRV